MRSRAGPINRRSGLGRRILRLAPSKATVASLTRTLAVEWAQGENRVNAVAPGYVRTEMMEDLIRQGNIEYDAYPPLAAMRPFLCARRDRGPVAFLVSSDAGFITGVTLPVDGGLAATKVP